MREGVTAAGRGGGRVAGRGTHWAIRRFLEACPPERPLVWCSTTSTWAESVFLDLIEHIADLSREAPLLLLCMARESCSTSGPRGPAAS